MPAHELIYAARVTRPEPSQRPANRSRGCCTGDTARHADGAMGADLVRLKVTRRPSIATAKSLYSAGLYQRICMFRFSPIAAPSRLPDRVLRRFRRGPGPARADLAGRGETSYASIVQRVQPAVVNVYAAKMVQNRNPLLDDPIFRRFFGVPGQQPEQMQRSLGSGVMVDPPACRDQQPRHRRRRPGQDFAVRQARIRGRDRAQGQPDRSRGTADQGRQGKFRRSISPIPTNCWSATSCWRSAIPSASADRNPRHHLALARTQAASPTTSSSSRPMPRSTPAIPAARWST